MSLFGPTFADGDRLDVAGVTVRLKVHSRARRVSLRLDRTRREFIATAPNPRRLGEAAAFARQRADWIAARLAELPAAQTVAPGEIIEIFGQACRLELAKRGSVQSLPEVLAARGFVASDQRRTGFWRNGPRSTADNLASNCPASRSWMPREGGGPVAMADRGHPRRSATPGAWPSPPSRSLTMSSPTNAPT